MEKYCFFNGKTGPLSEISVDDIGFLRGYGVFEVLRTYSFKPFLLEEHLNRLESSARFLGLEGSPSRKVISDAIRELILMFSGKEVSLRIVLTGGRSKDGWSFDPASPTFLIIAEDFVGPGDDLYEKGVHLFPVEHRRIFPEAKTLNYIFPIKTKLDLEGRGFFDLLYTSDGMVLESSTSNFFIVKGGNLITSADNVLMGITRGFVIDIAKDSFGVEERPIKFDELAMADEAFITATNKEILPVTRIGELTIGSGSVGAVTKELMSLFKERAKNQDN